jgi:hypothetical protein
MDGHWVRTREATRGALSADNAGRVKSEIALSKHANSPRSRPITPQDCVSENDRGRERYRPDRGQSQSHGHQGPKGRDRLVVHKLNTLYDDRLDGRITGTHYDQKAAQIESQQAELRRNIAESEAARFLRSPQRSN